MKPTRRERRWVDRLVVEAVHLDLSRAHGGMPGLRDENALESALARPRHLWTHGSKPDLAQLAAAYGFGLTRDHPFADGNKRTGFVAMGVFLGLNGHEIDAPEAEVIATMLNLAADDLSETELAAWVRSHLLPGDE